MPEESETKKEWSFLGNREEDQQGEGDLEGEDHQPLKEGDQGIERGEAREHRGCGEEIRDECQGEEPCDHHALDSSPAGPEQEAMLPGGGDVPGREEPGEDEVAADLFKETGEETEDDRKYRKSECPVGDRCIERLRERSLGEEDERGMDHLDQDEEECSIQKEGPGEVIPPDEKPGDHEGESHLKEEGDKKRYAHSGIHGCSSMDGD